MAQFPNFPFDPAQMAQAMQQGFAAFMPKADMSAMSPSALMAAQKKNMDALMAANTAAAEAYQDLFKKQVAVFEETLKAVQAQVAGFDPMNPAKTPEIAQAAVTTAAKNMTMLAEEAAKANAAAFKAVQAQIEASVRDISSMAKSL